MATTESVSLNFLIHAPGFSWDLLGRREIVEVISTVWGFLLDRAVAELQCLWSQWPYSICTNFGPPQAVLAYWGLKIAFYLSQKG